MLKLVTTSMANAETETYVQNIAVTVSFWLFVGLLFSVKHSRPRCGKFYRAQFWWDYRLQHEFTFCPLSYSKQSSKFEDTIRFVEKVHRCIAATWNVWNQNTTKHIIQLLQKLKFTK